MPEKGVGGDWIVKFPDSEGITENEFAMMSLAARVGILVPDLRLFPLADLDGIPAVWKSRGGNAFAIRRFDRGPNGRRIHTEDFAQAFGMFPEQKYERHSYANIAAFLLSRAGLQAALDFTRRVVFSVLIGNGDMHLKNVSLLYKNPLRPTLSPAYDLLYSGVCTRLALGPGRSREIRHLAPKRIMQYAASAGLPLGPVTSVVQDTLQQTVKAWRDLPEKDLLPREIKTNISQHLRQAVRRTQHLLEAHPLRQKAATGTASLSG